MNDAWKGLFDYAVVISNGTRETGDGGLSGTLVHGVETEDRRESRSSHPRSNVEGGTVSPSYSRNHNLEASRVVTNRWVQMSRDVTVIPPPTPGNLVDLPWSAPLTSAAPTVVGLDDARRSGYCSRGDQRSSRPCCLIGRRCDRHIRGWCFVLPSVCCVALQTERADPLYFLTD